MLTNTEFLHIISESFHDFLKSGTSRSTAKLKKLHGAIAKDLHERLGNEYQVWSQGYLYEKENFIMGRYLNKRVDITVKKGDKSVAGIAVKFVMQNYSQNSNNYFENMLGETANIRCNHCPYFQIFIILDKLPYYNNEGEIRRWESFSLHNISKYEVLSKDDINVYYHTPNKTLIFVIHIPDNENIKTKKEYLSFYKENQFNMEISNNKYYDFSNSDILNDYEKFMEKVFHTIMAL